MKLRLKLAKKSVDTKRSKLQHFYIKLLKQRLLMLFPTQYKNLFRKRTSGMFLMSLFSVITSNFQLVWYNLSLFFLFEISFSFYLKEAFPCFINFKKFHLFVKKWSWQFFQAIMFCTFQWSLLIFVNYWSDMFTTLNLLLLIIEIKHQNFSYFNWNVANCYA